VNSHPTRPITIPMATDKDRKAMTPEEKNEEWCTMIDTLAMIHNALQTIIGNQDLIDKKEVMVAIRSVSMVGDPIVNCFDHCLDEQEGLINHIIFDFFNIFEIF
jgi:hypothetical protein